MLVNRFIRRGLAIDLLASGSEDIQLTERQGSVTISAVQGGYYYYLGARWGRVACVPGSPTIKSRPHYRTGTCDYLRACARFHSVSINYDRRRHEHEGARTMQKATVVTIPLAGFGASDCSCPSHLYFSKRCPHLL
jgi:Uri superfamily endonuclease